MPGYTCPGQLEPSGNTTATYGKILRAWKRISSPSVSTPLDPDGPGAAVPGCADMPASFEMSDSEKSGRDAWTVMGAGRRRHVCVAALRRRVLVLLCMAVAVCTIVINVVE